MISRSVLLLALFAWSNFCDGQSNSTEIVIYRPKSFLSCLWTAKATVDDSIQIKLRNGELQRVVLAQGSHQVRTRKSDFAINATDTAYIRLFYDYNMLFGRVLVTEVAPQTARSEMSRLRDEFSGD